MKGKEYLDFLEEWELISDNSLNEVIERFEPETLEQFLNQWSKLQINSLKNDDIWNYDAGLPMIPTSGDCRANIESIANMALYDDRQIINDPIDIALGIAGCDPIKYSPRFRNILKTDLENIIKLQPLMRENLIEIMPYQHIISKFSKRLKNQLNRDWSENESLKYIEERMKWKVYLESNILAFRIGDLDISPMARYGIISRDGMEETDDGFNFQFYIPSDLEGIDNDTINNWIAGEFYKQSSQVANNINEKILFAELFSGSIATSEILTYEIIKRKNSNVSQQGGGAQFSMHYIPILGKVNLEKFIDFRANELPSFVSFREEWNEGRGLFTGEVSAKGWSDNLNQELDNCKTELKKNKKVLQKNILESAGWAGLGVGFGVLGGALLTSAAITAILPFVRDIKNSWADYLHDRSSTKTSTPFFLLNVIDKNTNKIKTDIPPDLPKKITISKKAIESSIPTMTGAPIYDSHCPQTREKGRKFDSSSSSNFDLSVYGYPDSNF